MIKTNRDILKDTKASTLHMTTNIIHVTDIKLDAWNCDSGGTVSSCACEVSEIRKQEHGSADIPDHYWSQKQTCKPLETGFMK